MEQPVKLPFCFDVRLCGKKKKYALCKYSYDKNIPMNFRNISKT